MTDNKQTWVTLPTGGRMEKEYFLDNVKECRRSTNYKKYFYEDVGNKDDHIHCNICMQTISGRNIVYCSDNNSVCESCFTLFVDTADFEKNIADLSPADRPT